MLVKHHIQIPPAFDDVALIDAKTAAAVGGLSQSWWYGQVASGRAPQPVIRAPKCSRWRLADVREFWASLIEPAKPSADQRTAESSKRASTAKQAKRRAEASALEAA